MDEAEDEVILGDGEIDINEEDGVDLGDEDLDFGAEEEGDMNFSFGAGSNALEE